MQNFDKNYLNDNIKLIGGIDEAGRGPLAGPVVVACVIMPLGDADIIENVNDSKKLTAAMRENLFEQIVKKAICFSVEIVDEKIIDSINILNATKLGMENCIKKIKIKPDLVLIDAVKIKTEILTDSIIKGDEKSYNIAAASIVAKVTRDRIMCEYDKSYPLYKFAKHKGYATKLHIELLKKFGECKIHRQSFIKNFKDAK